jgi:hypothetical protein
VGACRHGDTCFSRTVQSGSVTGSGTQAPTGKRLMSQERSLCGVAGRPGVLANTPPPARLRRQSPASL